MTVRLHQLRYYSSLPITFRILARDFPRAKTLRLAVSCRSTVWLAPCVPSFLFIRSTGIFTCCPSTTPFGLALGPDLPWEVQLYPGILRHSTYMILTYISLLIPAFSQLPRPPLLARKLHPIAICSSTTSSIDEIHSFGIVFKPRVFSAQDLSTSELLRTL